MQAISIQSFQNKNQDSTQLVTVHMTNSLADTKQSKLILIACQPIKIISELIVRTMC